MSLYAQQMFSVNI